MIPQWLPRICIPRDHRYPTDSPNPRRHIAGALGIASLALLIFIALYGLVAAWFLLTAWRLARGAFLGTASMEGMIASGCAAFMALFLLKGLVFVKRSPLGKDHEVTRLDQPHLFAFLDRLSAEAGAPRPNRVFLSPRVNACVFFDLSPLNLILPSRKNLDIGLGLVAAHFMEGTVCSPWRE